MTVPQIPPRHALLPDRERSRAVLVGSNAGLRQWPSPGQPEELTARLAQALTSPGPGGAFHRENTTLLLGPERPADVLDALRHAAGTASDVLLFWYAGRGLPREGGLAFGVTETDPRHAADTDTGVDVNAVAEIMSTGRAARPAVILDCDHATTATTRFTGTDPAPALMAAETSSFRPMADPFTETLVDGLTNGVQEGPEALDLVTLHNAIEAAYTRTRYYVENEYIGGPSHVLLRGGRELALAMNPAFALPNHPGALPPHPDVVHAQESW